MWKFMLLSTICAVFTIHFAQSIETITLKEEDVPQHLKNAATVLNPADELIRYKNYKNPGLCKELKCEKKNECHSYECNCTNNKYPCRCAFEPYKCCQDEQYKCKCYDEKYDCECSQKKYQCNCKDTEYDCRCKTENYKCNCKKHKYICGYSKGHRHGKPEEEDYGNHHGHGHDNYMSKKKSWFYKYPVYCANKVCDTCSKNVCDKCTKTECETCTKQVCNTCTRRKCLETCTKQVCKTCKKKVCDTCTERECKTCKSCKKVLVGCKYFLVKCERGHGKDDKKHY